MRISIIGIAIICVLGIAGCGKKIVEVEKPVIVEVPVIEPTPEMDCGEAICAHSQFQPDDAGSDWRPLCLRPELYDKTRMEFIDAPKNHGIKNMTMKGFNEAGYYYDGKGADVTFMANLRNGTLNKYTVTMCREVK